MSIFILVCNGRSTYEQLNIKDQDQSLYDEKWSIGTKNLQVHIWSHHWPQQESLTVIVCQYYTLLKMIEQAALKKALKTYGQNK